MAPTRRIFARNDACRCLGGAVAQLGERLVRNEEVRGSTPLGSTSFCVRFIGFSASGRSSPNIEKVGLSQRWHSGDGHGDHSTTQIHMAGPSSTPRPSVIAN